MSYTKLDSGIIFSTIWHEPHATVKVWITMLAMKNRYGEVHASIPGLAGAAYVTIEECLAALATFRAPDQFSRTKDNDGRRIEDMDGGWLVLNHDKYRAKDDAEDRNQKAADRMRRLRERRAADGAKEPVREQSEQSEQSEQFALVTQKLRQADTDADADAVLKPPAPKNWLGPFCDLWSATYGDGSGHSVAGRLAKAIRPLVTKHGSEKVIQQLRNYLKQTPIDFATPSGFAAKFGAWTGTRTNGTTGQSKQERGREAMARSLQRREAQHGKPTSGDEVLGAVPRALSDPRNR